MADKKPDQEPSIEEILASIRQIISDDEEGAATPAVQAVPPPPPSKPVPAPEPEIDDVIDLTEKADPEPEPIPIQVALRDAEDEPVVEPESVLESGDDFAMVDSPREGPVPPLNENSYADESAIDSLLTERAEKAALSAFSKIATRAPVYRDDTPADGHTIEDVVRSLLRPLLREWLDENLPPMIEKLVQRELEKLARRTMA